MRRAAVFACVAFMFVLVGCSQPESRPAMRPSTPEPSADSTPTYSTLDEAAGDLGRRAAQGDVDYFKRYVRSQDASSAYALMQAVVRGNVSTDYRSRVDTSLTGAHLDFHDHGNFQVYLQKHDGVWTISEMWPCY